MKLIVNVILSFVTVLINLILLPINTLIETYFPPIQTALTSVNNLLGWLSDFTTWVISWLPFDSNFFTFTLVALVFIYTIPAITNIIKLVVKWWHYLVP